MSEDDARLILAAPDMLAALYLARAVLAIQFGGVDSAEHKALMACDAAIAAAEAQS
jgi:hypothetical protein